MQYNYTVLYEPLPEGGFQVHVPAMPEIVTYGRNREEARRMAEDAIRCVLESARKTGEPIPQSRVHCHLVRGGDCHSSEPTSSEPRP